MNTLDVQLLLQQGPYARDPETTNELVQIFTKNSLLSNPGICRMKILMGFAKPAMPQGTSHDIYSVSAQIFFQKNALSGQFLASEASQNKEGWVPPTPLPHLKF